MTWGYQVALRRTGAGDARSRVTAASDWQSGDVVRLRPGGPIRHHVHGGADAKALREARVDHARTDSA